VGGELGEYGVASVGEEPPVACGEDVELGERQGDELAPTSSSSGRSPAMNSAKLSESFQTPRRSNQSTRARSSLSSSMSKYQTSPRC
jgi:hypothetical protein